MAADGVPHGQSYEKEAEFAVDGADFRMFGRGNPPGGGDDGGEERQQTDGREPFGIGRLLPPQKPRPVAPLIMELKMPAD